MEATETPISKGLDKEDVAHTCNGILLQPSKRVNNAIAATWMVIEIVTLSEAREAETSYDTPYMLNLKRHHTKGRICKIETDSQT